jgi:hypothetical protein
VAIDELGDSRATVPDEMGDLFAGQTGIKQHRDKRVPQLARRPINWIQRQRPP